MSHNELTRSECSMVLRIHVFMYLKPHKIVHVRDFIYSASSLESRIQK